MNAASPGGHEPGRLKYFFISLLLLMTIYPWFERGGIHTVFFNLFMTAVLLSGAYFAGADRRRIVVAVCLLLPALLAGWSDAIMRNTAVAASAHSLRIIFFIFIIWTVLAYVLAAKRVTRDMIFGAISAYLLIGIAWTSAYALLEALQPGSFSIDEAQTPDFYYYSFTTLTTLGYGDITPVTSRAKSMAVLEAVNGVLYIAVLIARLVGTHIAHSLGSSGR